MPIFCLVATLESTFLEGIGSYFGVFGGCGVFRNADFADSVVLKCLDYVDKVEMS